MKPSRDIVIGFTEKVVLLGNNGKSKSIVARVDTGAEISSVDCKVAAEMELGPVIKTKKIKNANGITERPVVKCRFVIKGKVYSTDVTIADRKNLKYLVLLGQNLLKRTPFYIHHS